MRFSLIQNPHGLQALRTMTPTLPTIDDAPQMQGRETPQTGRARIPFPFHSSSYSSSVSSELHAELVAELSTELVAELFFACPFMRFSGGFLGTFPRCHLIFAVVFPAARLAATSCCFAIGYSATVRHVEDHDHRAHLRATSSAVTPHAMSHCLSVHTRQSRILPPFSCPAQ